MTRRNTSYIYKLRAWGVLASSAIAVAGAGWTAATDPKPVDFLPIVLLIGGAIMSDKIGDVFSAYASDRDRDEIKSLFEDLPKTLIASHHIVSFPIREQGLDYCRYASRSATRILNTAARYGATYTVGSLRKPNAADESYRMWIEARRDAIRRGCQVRELISKYLAADDPVRVQAIRLTKENNRYQFRQIDDVINPIVQMTIFYFDDYKEVVLGWELPGAEEGRSFASRDPRVVEYFEAYFDVNYQQSVGQTWASK